MNPPKSHLYGLVGVVPDGEVAFVGFSPIPPRDSSQRVDEFYHTNDVQRGARRGALHLLNLLELQTRDTSDPEPYNPGRPFEGSVQTHSIFFELVSSGCLVRVCLHELVRARLDIESDDKREGFGRAGRLKLTW